MNELVTAYKLARPDGYDFHTGKTIMYRNESYPHTVKCPSIKPCELQYKACTKYVLHASENPNDCFVGANIPCSAYKVEGIPVCTEYDKMGFVELNVLEEITDLDKLFGWKYNEAVNPINPLLIRTGKPVESDIELLKQWASVENSVRASVQDSVWASVWDSVWDSIRASVWGSMGNIVRNKVGDRVEASVGDSVWASVWAYTGSLFPNITKWKYASNEQGEYLFQSAVDLWKRGFVPSFDGEIWRLHSGENANIVFKL